MRTPEQIAEAFVHGLMGDNERTTVQRWMLAQTIANAVKEATRQVEAAPAFKPNDVPDNYRDQWERIQYPFDSPRWMFGIQVFGPRGKSEYIEVFPVQARRILETLSSEDTER